MIALVIADIPFLRKGLPGSQEVLASWAGE